MDVETTGGPYSGGHRMTEMAICEIRHYEGMVSAVPAAESSSSKAHESHWDRR